MKQWMRKIKEKMKQKFFMFFRLEQINGIVLKAIYSDIGFNVKIYSYQ